MVIIVLISSVTYCLHWLIDIKVIRQLLYGSEEKCLREYYVVLTDIPSVVYFMQGTQFPFMAMGVLDPGRQIIYQSKQVRGTNISCLFLFSHVCSLDLIKMRATTMLTNLMPTLLTKVCGFLQSHVLERDHLKRKRTQRRIFQY